MKNEFIPTQDIKSSKQLSNNDKVCGNLGIKGYQFIKGSMTNTGCEVKPVCCNGDDKSNKSNKNVNCVNKIDRKTISENSTKHYWASLKNKIYPQEIQ